MIGFGAIGTQILESLGALGEGDRLAACLVRPGRDAPAAVHDAAGLIQVRPATVLECAGHEAVADFGPAILAAGIDLVLSSLGALADRSVANRLLDSQRAGGGRLLMPAGAVAGLDGLTAAALAGIDEVAYISRKPPHAWRGTAAESLVDLDHPGRERLIFEGSARAAAATFPKNANVAVAVALAGIGLDRTRVRLLSSREVSDPLGLIEASGKFGRFRFEILALATAANPKTSALTAYSLLQAARLGTGLPVLELAHNLD
jgi:aspartate dehydrogenase